MWVFHVDDHWGRVESFREYVPPHVDRSVSLMFPLARILIHWIALVQCWDRQFLVLILTCLDTEEVNYYMQTKAVYVVAFYLGYSRSH